MKKYQKEHFQRRLIFICALVILVILLFGIILFLYHKFNNQDENLTISFENNSFLPNFDPDIYDYYLLTSDKEIKVKCSFGEKEVIGCDEVIDLSNYSSYIHKIMVDDLVYNFYIKVKESDSEKNISIDSLSIIPSSWTNKEIDLNVLATSSNKLISYSIDNGDSWQKSSSFKVKENGHYDIIVKDEYGNETAVRPLDISNIDEVSPVGEIIKAESSNDKIVLRVLAKDEESGISSYSWNDEKFSSKDSLIITKKGTYDVRIKDKAGNVSKRISINIKDSDFKDQKQFGVILYRNGADELTNDFLVCSTNDKSCVVTLPNIIREDGKVLGFGNSSVEYNQEEKITIDKNISLKALTEKKIVASFQDKTSVTPRECTLHNNDKYCYITTPKISFSSGKVIGWNTKKDSNTLIASPNSKIKIYDDSTFYALTYKPLVVKFDKNGADSLSSEREECRLLNGETTCFVTLPNVKRKGSEVVGWSTDKNSKKATYGPNGEIEVDSDKTLYAITKKDISIHFEKNGADSLSSSLEKCSIYNTSKECTITTPKIYRNSGTVLGWNTSSSAHDSIISTNAKIVVDKDATYYAITSKKVSAKFYENGANSISNKTLSCTFYNNSNGCVVVTPSIIRSSWNILGWSTNKNATSASLKQDTKVTIKKNTNYYAITSKKVSARFNVNNADYLENCDFNGDYCLKTCNIYNTNKSCSISLPYIYSTGNEVQFFSTNSDPSSTVGYSPSVSLNLFDNIELNAIVDNRYRKSTYNIVKTKKYGYTAVETDDGCPSNVYNNFYNFMDRLYNKVPYIFRAAKVTFTGTSNFTDTWGSYAGMTYGTAVGYRNVDLKCPDKYSTYYLQTMVHELTHSWDSYFKAAYGTALSDTSDFKNLYNKYAKASRKPLRDYAYTNMSEFVADVYAWYYFLYIDTSNPPTVIKNNTYYPSDMKKVMEKYIKIAKNGYK